MPRPEDPTNPHCPDCNSKTQKNGKTKTGKPSYRCTACRKSFTPSAVHGSEPIGDRPMTGAERQKKYNDNLSNAERQRQNERRNKARKRRNKSEIPLDTDNE